MLNEQQSLKFSLCRSTAGEHGKMKLNLWLSRAYKVNSFPPDDYVDVLYGFIVLLFCSQVSLDALHKLIFCPIIVIFWILETLQATPDIVRMRRLTTFIFHHTSHPWSQHGVLVWLVFSCPLSILREIFSILLLRFLKTDKSQLNFVISETTKWQNNAKLTLILIFSGWSNKFSSPSICVIWLSKNTN